MMDQGIGNGAHADNPAISSRETASDLEAAQLALITEFLQADRDGLRPADLGTAPLDREHAGLRHGMAARGDDGDGCNDFPGTDGVELCPDIEIMPMGHVARGASWGIQDGYGG